MDAVLRSRIASRVQAGADEAETTFRALGDHSGIAFGETAVGLFFSLGPCTVVTIMCALGRALRG